MRTRSIVTTGAVLVDRQGKKQNSRRVCRKSTGFPYTEQKRGWGILDNLI